MTYLVTNLQRLSQTAQCSANSCFHRPNGNAEHLRDVCVAEPIKESYVPFQLILPIVYPIVWHFRVVVSWPSSIRYHSHIPLLLIAENFSLVAVQHGDMPLRIIVAVSGSPTTATRSQYFLRTVFATRSAGLMVIRLFYQLLSVRVMLLDLWLGILNHSLKFARRVV